MKNIILLSFCLLLVVVSFSQSKTEVRDSTRYYTHYYFGLTFQQQEFSNLSSRIVQYYPMQIPKKTFGAVYGGKTAWGALAVQGDMGLNIGINSKRHSGSTGVVALTGTLDAGLFLTNGAIRIYPFVGLGIDMFIVTASISNRNIHFDSLLANPVTRVMADPVTFTTAFVSWRGGLAIDVGGKRFPGQPYVFGIRVGRRESFHSSRWGFNGQYGFVGSPSDKLQQWFAGLVLYGGIDLMDKKTF